MMFWFWFCGSGTISEILLGVTLNGDMFREVWREASTFCSGSSRFFVSGLESLWAYSLGSTAALLE